VLQIVKVGAFDLAARRGEALGAACTCRVPCAGRRHPAAVDDRMLPRPNDAIAATMSRSSRLYPLTAQIE